MKPSILITGIALITLASCGGGGGPSSAPARPVIQASKPDPQLESDSEGQFLARLSVLNESVAGPVTGSVTLSKEDKGLFIDVRFVGKNPGVLQTQYIHVGTRCPILAQDDSNADGFIDAAEAMAVTGKILVPLDGDLSSQDRGSSLFPITNEFGSYDYYEYTQYQRFFEDLRDGDLDPTDDMIKLGQEKSLNLPGRVVLVYGVPKDSTLPATVATRGNLTSFQSLPIACGVFSKVTTVPGTVDTDTGIGPAPSEGETSGQTPEDDGTIVIIDD